MDISALDKNFILNTELPEKDIEWYEADCEPFVIYGAFATSPRYLRMPEDTAAAVSDGVAVLNRNTAGIRAHFATDSPYIAIHVEWDGMSRLAHMPSSGCSGFDLYDIRESEYRLIAPFIPPVAENKSGYESLRYTKLCHLHDYVLNFPLYNDVNRLYIGIKRGSTLTAPATRYSNSKPVVFYGSSITQGGCASRPGNCYQNHLLRALNMDYINLGFSGNARGEKAMADYISGLDMSAFVCDYDHNAPDAEHLKNTHYALYEAVRKSHPQLPIVLVTKPDFHYSDSTRRAIVMDTYCRAIAAGDKNIHFIDGAGMFSGEERDACTVDCCHPNDLGFYLMAKSMLPVLKKILRG